MSYTNRVINTMDFSQIIGGPLTAAVNAQNLSAQATIEFIQEVGFHERRIKHQTIDSNGEVIELENVRKTHYTKSTGDTGDTTIKEVTATTPDALSGPIGDTVGETSVLAEVNATEAESSVRYVTFQYKLASEEGESTGEVKVPLLTIVPIPYLSIKTFDLDFAVKINETYVRDYSAESEQKSFGYAYGHGRGGGAGFGTTMARQSNYKSTGNTETSMDLKVKIHAANDDMPAGMSRILGILESNLIAGKK